MIYDTALKLEETAKQIRKDILEMTYKSGVNGGHIGGAFSSVEILTVLYGRVMNIFPSTVKNENRDRFILSKGHIAIGHYAALYEFGFISREEMLSFEEANTLFPTHEIMNIEKGIEVSSGSLGYGLSLATGIALSGKMKRKDYHTFVLMGDGECNEGTVWEAAMAAAKYGLSNLVAIVDINGQSLDGFTTEIMPINDMEKVWDGFGWNVIVVDNGNNIADILKAFESRSSVKPNVLLAKTVKGKGVSYIEGKVGWHHARINSEQYELFLSEVENV